MIQIDWSSSFQDGRVSSFELSFISKGLLGRFYISGAKIKGIKKYCYSKNKIKEIILKTGLELEKSVSVKRMGFELGKIMFLLKPKGF